MSMKLILHIGFPKTGTTTIQEHLILNKDSLLQQSFYVPPIDELGAFSQFGLENAGHAGLFLAAGDSGQKGWLFNWILLLLGMDPQNTSREYLREPWERTLRNVDENRKKADSVILSCECLSLCEENRVAAVRELLTRSFDEVKVIVYLRRQMESLISMYSEVHKIGGYFPTFETHLSIQKEVWENHFFNYEKVLALWGKYFGEKNITTRIFYRHEMVNNDLLDDFAKFAGFDNSALKREESKNYSLPSEVIEFLRLVNKTYPLVIPGKGVNINRVRMISALNARYAIAPGNRGFHPGRDLVREIINLYRDSNDAIARKYFARERLFDEDVSNYPEKTRPHGLTLLKSTEIGSYLWDAALQPEHDQHNPIS